MPVLGYPQAHACGLPTTLGDSAPGRCCQRISRPEAWSFLSVVDAAISKHRVLILRAGVKLLSSARILERER
jgi:hypothetical protein